MIQIKLLKCKTRYQISEFEFNVCILSVSNHCDSNRHAQCISCSARAHHQFYFIQTHFVNVSSLTVITAQHINHPLFLLVLIMVQHPWQTPLAYNRIFNWTKYTDKIHSSLKINKTKYVLYYPTFWYYTKYLDNMLTVRLKNDTHAQYHQIIGSQIGCFRKKRFSVLVIRKPLQPVTREREPFQQWACLFGTRLAAHMLLCSARLHHQFSLHSSSLSALFE